MRFPLMSLSIAAVLGLSATAALAASDREFMIKALQGDNSEMRLGQLAEDRGDSPAVRDFGRMLVQDHEQAKDQALAVARRLGVRPTDAMTPEARAEERKLRRLSGRAFDREFASYMVKDHRKDIAEFERQTRNGSGPTRRLAEDTLPALRRHLEVAQGLRG